MIRERRKPTPEEMAAAPGRTVPDLVRTDLAILFVGINPSLYSAALELHFARPGNRFWPTLIGAGFVPADTTAFEQDRLLERGSGITNIVDRATAAADELTDSELHEGARQLLAKVARLKPRVLAFLGLSAYRIAFDRRKARPGRQPETLGGTEVWVLPNPSGLNANYQLPELIRLYRELKGALRRNTMLKPTMPRLIERPTRIESAGNKPKIIDEYFGRVNSGTPEVSIARMQSPGGWLEPGQRPDFDEYTVVLSGALTVEHEGGSLVVRAGQGVLTRKGEWVRYSTPDAEGAEYIAVCLPAFSMDTVHRDA